MGAAWQPAALGKQTPDRFRRLFVSGRLDYFLDRQVWPRP